MAALDTSSVAEHLQPGLREIIGTRLGGRESFYSRLYNVQTTNRKDEDYLAATGLPIAVEKPEGTNIQAFNPVEGNTKTLTPKVYAIGFEVTEEAWEDDLYTSEGSALRDAATGLADALAERVEIEAHRPFNAEGFDGSTFLVLPDNTSGFFATSHNPITGAQGEAQNNRPSTNLDLNVTSYRAMLTQFRKYKNDQGIRIPGFTTVSNLVVPPDLEYTALEVTGNPTRPDSGNDIVNVTRGRSGVISSPYITDTDQWIGQGAKHYAYFLWRWRPRMDSFDDRRARVAVMVAYQRFSYAPVHWLGYYGSPGST